MTSMTSEKLSEEGNKKLNRGICPKCNSTHFVKGPQGGSALNIACENGHRFWFGPPFTAEYQGVIRVEREGDYLKAYF